MKTRTDIFAIHPGALGDCILLGRVLDAWRGEREVTFVGHAAVTDLLVGLGVIQKKIDFDLLPMHELFLPDAPMEESKLAEQLGECDRLISVYGQGNSAAEQRLIRACGAKRATFLPIRPPAEYPGHLAELWLEKLASPLQKSDLCKQRWPVPFAWRQAGGRKLADAGAANTKRYVILQPGAGGEQKRWAIERFVEVAVRIQSRLDRLPVFVLGPVECEMFAKGEINFLRAHPLVLSPTLEEFAGLLAGADAFIGNDSGPAHLAASVGTTTACIFRTTSPIHFHPLGQHVTTYQATDMPEDIADQILSTITH